MRMMRLAAMAIGLVLAAGSAQSAQFDDYVYAGQYKVYTFTFGDGPSSTVYGSTVGILGKYAFTDDGFDVISYYDYFPSFSCSGTPSVCSTGDLDYKWVGVGYGNVLSLYVENHNYNYNVCKTDHSGPRGYCSSYYQPLSVSSYFFPDDGTVSITTGTIPEPATWAMMIAGFGLVGSTLRRRRAIATLETL